MKKRLSLAFASLSLAAACSSPSGPDPVSGPTIPLEAGSTLVFLDSGSLDSQRATIEQKVRDTLAAVRQLMASHRRADSRQGRGLADHSRARDGWPGPGHR